MIALYDYKPLSDSPNANCNTELQFQAGDHIVIYGNMVLSLHVEENFKVAQLFYYSTVMDFILDN